MESNQTQKSNNSFVTFFRKLIEIRASNQLSCFNYDIALKHLENFTSQEDIPFKNLKKDWFKDFRSYLVSSKGLKSEKPLSSNSANTYFRIVHSVAKEAADNRFIAHHEISETANTQRTKSKDSSLSMDELQRLAQTPCRVPALKQAFLFSCLTGIQWKELSILTWAQVEYVNGTWQINLSSNGIQKFTPLNQQARDLLGSQRNLAERIFQLHYSAALCVNLNQWALKAGVLRNITFHLARQTFGKMLLDNGVAIELVSELLGHQHLRTTKKAIGRKEIKLRWQPSTRFKYLTCNLILNVVSDFILARFNSANISDFLNMILLSSNKFYEQSFFYFS